MSFTRSVNAAIGDSRGWVRSHRLQTSTGAAGGAMGGTSPLPPSPPSPPSSVITSTNDSDGGFSSVSHPRPRSRAGRPRPTPGPAAPTAPSATANGHTAYTPPAPPPPSASTGARGPSPGLPLVPPVAAAGPVVTAPPSGGVASGFAAAAAAATMSQRHMHAAAGAVASSATLGRRPVSGHDSLPPPYLGMQAVSPLIPAGRVTQGVQTVGVADGDADGDADGAAVAWAEVDRLQGELAATKAQLVSETDSRALVQEELREVRASLSRQARLLNHHAGLDAVAGASAATAAGAMEWGGAPPSTLAVKDRPPSRASRASSPASAGAASGASGDADDAAALTGQLSADGAKYAAMAARLEQELQALKADKDAELQRLDSFLVMAGQENSALRRQLLAAGITPDVVQADGTGAGVLPSDATAHARRGLVVTMLSERAAKTRADADKEVLTASLAQAEANLACEKSERATVERQLQDALMAIDLTHSEMGSQATRITELETAVDAKAAAHRQDVDALTTRLQAAREAVEAAGIEMNRRVEEVQNRLIAEHSAEVARLEASITELKGVVTLLEQEGRAAAQRYQDATARMQHDHRAALRQARDDNTRLTQLLEKRQRDYEAELQELETRFTTIIQQRQRTYDRDIARLREETDVKMADAAARAAEQTRAAMDVDLKRLRDAAEMRTAEESSRAVQETREEMAAKVEEAFSIVAKIKDESRKEVAAAVARARAADSSLPSKMALQEQLSAAKAERDEFKQAYAREARRRRAVHQKLMDLQGNIRVHARVRPATHGVAAQRGMTDLIRCTGEGEMVLRAEGLVGDHRRENVKFEFDVVHTPEADQEHVFSAVKPLCESVLDGYNVCVFAYGQTGSGKTYTMEGTPEAPGVTLRAVRALFNMVKDREPGAEYSFKISMVEVYLERVRDLLEGQVVEDGTLRPAMAHRRKPESSEFKEGLAVREGAGGCEIVGLTSIAVNSVEEVVAAVQRGVERRAIGTHSLNEHSSRSHMVIRIAVEGAVYQGLMRAGSADKLPGGAKGGRVTRLRSVLNLIDLAGSERVLRTEVSGMRLKEAQSINKSLSALGDVIAAHKSGSSHVPYRNSKLTFLLKDSLGGDSKVMMFVNVSGDDDNVSETFYSLTFASRCRATALGRARRHVTNSASASTPSHGPRRTASSASLARHGSSRTFTDLSVVSDTSDVAPFNGDLLPDTTSPSVGRGAGAGAGAGASSSGLASHGSFAGPAPAGRPRRPPRGHHG